MLGTISAFVYRHRETKKNLCRGDRSQDPILYSSMTAALEGGEWSAARPGRTLPSGKTRYPLYRRLGGPQDRPEQVKKISLSTGFDPGPSSP